MRSSWSSGSTARVSIPANPCSSKVRRSVSSTCCSTMRPSGSHSGNPDRGVGRAMGPDPSRRAQATVRLQSAAGTGCAPAPRRSSLVGPCPGTTRVAGGERRDDLAQRRAPSSSWSPPGRSVRPMVPANSTSPVNATGSSSTSTQVERGALGVARRVPRDDPQAAQLERRRRGLRRSAAAPNVSTRAGRAVASTGRRPRRPAPAPADRRGSCTACARARRACRTGRRAGRRPRRAGRRARRTRPRAAPRPTCGRRGRASRAPPPGAARGRATSATTSSATPAPASTTTHEPSSCDQDVAARAEHRGDDRDHLHATHRSPARPTRRRRRGRDGGTRPGLA